MTVYLDSVFALNFAVNWLLLRAAARLGAAAVRPRRIAAAAALGAAYAVAVYLPGCGVLAGWAGKLAVTAALLAVAFGLRRETLRLAAVFGGVTLALCGAVYGLELLKHGRVRPGALWYPVTFSSLVLTAGGVYAATRLLLPRLCHAPDSVVPVRLTLGGRRVFLSALRDSGNTLCDPVTGEAVLVADWRCAARLLPHDGLRAADFAAPAALVAAPAAAPPAPHPLPRRRNGQRPAARPAVRGGPHRKKRAKKRPRRLLPDARFGRRRLRGPDRREMRCLNF